MAVLTETTTRYELTEPLDHFAECYHVIVQCSCNHAPAAKFLPFPHELETGAGDFVYLFLTSPRATGKPLHIRFSVPEPGNAEPDVLFTCPAQMLSAQVDNEEYVRGILAESANLALAFLALTRRPVTVEAVTGRYARRLFLVKENTR